MEVHVSVNSQEQGNFQSLDWNGKYGLGFTHHVTENRLISSQFWGEGSVEPKILWCSWKKITMYCWWWSVSEMPRLLAPFVAFSAPRGSGQLRSAVLWHYSRLPQPCVLSNEEEDEQKPVWRRRRKQAHLIVTMVTKETTTQRLNPLFSPNSGIN